MAQESDKTRRESHIRSLLKGCTWRLVATATTISIAYFVIGDVEAAATIGGIEVVAKILIYYVHERLWQLAPRGAVRKFFGIIKRNSSSNSD